MCPGRDPVRFNSSWMRMRSSAFASWRPRNSGCRRTRPSLHLGAEVGLALFAEGGGPLGRNGGCRGVLAISLPVLAGRLYDLTGGYETVVVVTGGANLLQSWWR